VRTRTLGTDRIVGPGYVALDPYPILYRRDAIFWSRQWGPLYRFYREEQRELAQVVLQGKLSKLERKTSEPIAHLAGRHRKPVQHFVGAGCWGDENVMAELRQHVCETLADPDGVLALDPSGFPKKGPSSDEAPQSRVAFR
jgi:hypothetical protein